MSNDISDEERELERRMREKLLGNQEARKRSTHTTRTPASLPVEYHFYSHQIANERGGADTYWRFDRIQGETGGIHREFNSKALAMIELDRLRKDGNTVHVIQTPDTMTLEAKERSNQEAHAKWKERMESFSVLRPPVKEQDGE